MQVIGTDARRGPVIDVAQELTSLSRAELEKLLDRLALTRGGIHGSSAGG